MLTISFKALDAWCDRFRKWVEYVAAVRLSRVVVSGKPARALFLKIKSTSDPPIFCDISRPKKTLGSCKAKGL